MIYPVDSTIQRLNNPGQEKSNPITLFTLLTLSKTKAGAMAKLSSSVTYHWFPQTDIKTVCGKCKLQTCRLAGKRSKNSAKIILKKSLPLKFKSFQSSVVFRAFHNAVYLVYLLVYTTLLISFSHISPFAPLDLLKLGANRLDIDPGATWYTGDVTVGWCGHSWDCYN